MRKLNIGVVGAGISGLSAAWLLARKHRVTLFEKGSYFGGHANTVDVGASSGSIAVDTGFIVFNERTYPNLCALFEHLNVDTHPTLMGFSFSSDGGAYEYSGSSVGGFFGQPSNLVRFNHWCVLRDIARFFKTADERLRAYPEDVGLGRFLAREGYSDAFVENHILPMGAAIWSTDKSEMARFPARSFVNFYANHGMLQFLDRPVWRTVVGGSRQYVKALLDDSDIELRANERIARVVRHPNFVHVVDEFGVVRPFDHVILAGHADDALEIIDDADSRERHLLSKFEYQENVAVLHKDHRYMPKRKRLWSSWNYMKRGTGENGKLCVTYWMNELQKLQTDTDLFVTLNPFSEIHPKYVERTIAYRHPVFSSAAMTHQRDLWSLQGRRRVWFCGCYFGYGFHEDGLQSGLAVAEQLGGVRRPWDVQNESGRIHLKTPSIAEAAE